MTREVRKHRLLSISIDPCARQTGVLQTIPKGYEGGNGIVGIDLSKVGSFQAEVWQTAPRVNRVEGLPCFRSIWAQEVTVFQETPQSAIIKLPVKK